MCSYRDLNPGPLRLKINALPLSYKFLKKFFVKKLLNGPIIFEKNVLKIISPEQSRGI